MIILDSSAIINLLRGTEKGKTIKNALKNENYATTAFCVHEVLIGSEEKEALMSFFKSISVLSFDAEASFKSIEIENTLRKKGKLIGKIDLFIASICVVHNMQLMTTDNDFKNIPDLKLLLF